MSVIFIHYLFSLYLYLYLYIYIYIHIIHHVMYFHNIIHIACAVTMAKPAAR